jgi:argininosuccinate synthase
MRVLLAYSGGLDTSYLVAWLTRVARRRSRRWPSTAAAGAREERRRLEARALAPRRGRAPLRRRAQRDVPARHALADRRQRAPRRRLSVVGRRRARPAGRMLAREAARVASTPCAHGCTAAGNDQVRFEAALATIAPASTCSRPCATSRPAATSSASGSRAGFPVPPAGGKYSVNQGLWGVTIGGGELHTSIEALPEDAWYWTKNGRKRPRDLQIGFEGGVPVALNGGAARSGHADRAPEPRGRRVGVGRGYHLGDTVLGIKGRIAFEAPAAEVLIAAHRELEKLVLIEDQRFLEGPPGRRLRTSPAPGPVPRSVPARHRGLLRVDAGARHRHRHAARAAGFGARRGRGVALQHAERQRREVRRARGFERDAAGRAGPGPRAGRTGAAVPSRARR